MITTSWWDAPAGVRRQMQTTLRDSLGEHALDSESSWRNFILSTSPMFACEGGALWTPDEAQRLHCAVFASHVQLPVFEEQTRQMTLSPGVGLPGRVWEHRTPEFISNVLLDDNFPRLRGAIRDLIRGVMGLPILQRGSPIAVVEFFSRNTFHADGETAAAMQDLGEAIGKRLPENVPNSRGK